MAAALITGITGQDGGYLADQLTGQGWSVHGIVRPGEDVPDHLPSSVTLHEAELLDGDLLEAIVSKVAPAEIYNLAGLSSVARSWDDPVQTMRVNAEVVARLLELAHQSPGTVRVLQASSAEMFAGSGVAPQTESTPIVPTSPYGVAKACAHHLVGVYRARGLHAVSAILYNHESPRRPASFVTRKITSTVAAIADGRADQLVLGSLDSRRDWGWAPEYVDAMTRALRFEAAQDWVIATGRSHSVRDFVEAAFRHVGVTHWQDYVSTDAAFLRPVDAPDLVGDASKARRLLGWTPRVGLAELVGRMVDTDRDGSTASALAPSGQ